MTKPLREHRPVRKIKASEIELRVGQINSKSLTLLLYKDSRTDMNILDELYGWDGWKRDHKEVNGVIYAGVSVWSDKRNDWITKWDAGESSNQHGDKGASSDSFKRACVNFGIGRELYSAPKITIWDNGNGYISQNHKGKDVSYENFKVGEIEYTDNAISFITILDGKGKEVFRHGEKHQEEQKKKVLETPKHKEVIETTESQNKEVYLSNGMNVREYDPEAPRDWRMTSEDTKKVSDYNGVVEEAEKDGILPDNYDPRAEKEIKQQLITQPNILRFGRSDSEIVRDSLESLKELYRYEQYKKIIIDTKKDLVQANVIQNTKCDNLTLIELGILTENINYRLQKTVA